MSVKEIEAAVNELGSAFNKLDIKAVAISYPRISRSSITYRIASTTRNSSSTS
jgi:hypothetical protein